jgi:hypothetical protein
MQCQPAPAISWAKLSFADCCESYFADEARPAMLCSGAATGTASDPKLRFHANDLGKAAFDAEPLALTPRGLVLNRYETQIRFIRMSH